MSDPARRRMAGLGTFLLTLSMLVFTMGGPAVGLEEQGGQYEPPAGCIKMEEEGTPRVVGVDGPVVVGDVTVTFTWIPKEGEPGEWIGFTWAATGGIAGGTVKAANEDLYTWGPAASGTFTVPEVGGIVHAISFVIVCQGETPTTPATEPTTPATSEVTLPSQGSTVPSSVPVSVLPTTVTLAPQQAATTAVVATLPFTGTPVGAGVVPLAMSLLGMGAAMLSMAKGGRRIS
ncbi:MAG: hypothetical protein R6X29_04120 [Acidimicrobiia bacterium]|jgi:hypothetical protein